jgi:hypothetical protein
MDMALPDDRKALRDSSGSDYFLERLKPRKWIWYDVAKDSATLYGAVPLIKKV